MAPADKTGPSIMDAFGSDTLFNAGPVSILCNEAQPWRVASPKDQPLLANLNADCLTPLTFLGEGAYGCVELCRVSVPVSGCSSKPGELKQEQDKDDTAPIQDSAYTVYGCSGGAYSVPDRTAGDVVVVRPGRFALERLRLSSCEPPCSSAALASGRPPAPANGQGEATRTCGATAPSFPCQPAARPASSPASSRPAVVGAAGAIKAVPGHASLLGRTRSARSHPSPPPAPSSASSLASTPTAATGAVISNELVVAVKRIEYQGGRAGRGGGANGGDGGAAGASGSAKARRNMPSRARLGRMQAIELLQLSRCRECPFIVRVFGCVPDAPGGSQCPGLRSSAPTSSSSGCRIVMEWAEGGDLGSFLQALAGRRTPSSNPSRERLLMGEDGARFYMGCLLEALSFLHSRGLMHRDVKPANLLLSSDGRAKLGDLGMACHVDKEGLAVGRAGTPNYMAPEVWAYGTLPKYSSGYGVTADLWSAGVLLHELLTGHLPANHPDAYLRRNWRFAPRCAAFSPELCDLLSRLLSVKRRHRPQSCAEAMAHPWFAGFDWQALRDGTMPAPYVPAKHRPQASAMAAAPERWPLSNARPSSRGHSGPDAPGLVSGHMAPVVEDGAPGDAAGYEFGDSGVAAGDCGSVPARSSGASGGARCTASLAAGFQPRLPSPVAHTVPALVQSETPRLPTRGRPSWPDLPRTADSVEVGPAAVPPATSAPFGCDGPIAVGRSAPAWTFGIHFLGQASTATAASSTAASPRAQGASGSGSVWASGSAAATPTGAPGGSGGNVVSGLASMANALVSALVPSSRTTSGELRSSIGVTGRPSSGLEAGRVPSCLAKSSDGLPSCMPAICRAAADASSVRYGATPASAACAPSSSVDGNACVGLRCRTDTSAVNTGRPPRPPNHNRQGGKPPAPFTKQQRTVSYPSLLRLQSPSLMEAARSIARGPATAAARSDGKHAQLVGGGVSAVSAGPRGEETATVTEQQKAPQLPLLSTLMSLPRGALALGAVGRQSGDWMQRRLADAASFATAAVTAAAAALNGSGEERQDLEAPQDTTGHATGPAVAMAAAVVDAPCSREANDWTAPSAEHLALASASETATGVVLVQRAAASSNGSDNGAKANAENAGSQLTSAAAGVVLPQRPAQLKHRYSGSFAFDAAGAIARLQHGLPPRTPAVPSGPSDGGFNFTYLEAPTEDDGSPGMLAGPAHRTCTQAPRAEATGAAKARPGLRHFSVAGPHHVASSAHRIEARARGAMGAEPSGGQHERPRNLAPPRYEAVARICAACAALLMAALVALRLTS